MNDKIYVCKTCSGMGKEYDGAAHTCTACNGIAAPVVERQPVAWYSPHWNGKSANWVFGPELGEQVFPEFWKALYTAPPELAELQATIARLTAENERIECMKENYRIDAKVYRDENERLKGGQGEAVDEIERLKGEPVAWRYAGCVYSNQPHSEAEPLYTSQPAPVSVVLPERRVIDDGDSDADQNSDHGWNACLDKVKELNQ